MITSSVSSVCMQDLPRTFPCHPWLDTPEGQASLRRVLVAYSFRDSDVGYCQVTQSSSFLSIRVDVAIFFLNYF